VDPPDQPSRVPEPFPEQDHHQEVGGRSVPEEQVEHGRQEVLQILRDLLLCKGAKCRSNPRRKSHFLSRKLFAKVKHFFPILI
jgi:hypothetical protein